MTTVTPTTRRLLGVLALAAVLALIPSIAEAKVRVYNNLATSFCLDSNAAGRAYTHRCNGGRFQKWNVTGGARVQLNNVSTNRCLDSNAKARVYTLRCNGGRFQHWQVIYNKNGTRTFRNVATRLCLDSNTKQRLYTHRCNGGSFQKWRVG
jgi:ricin-type beta-trefoil lectin protein